MGALSVLGDAAAPRTMHVPRLSGRPSALWGRRHVYLDAERHAPPDDEIRQRL